MKVLNTYYGFSDYQTYENDAKEFDIGFSVPELKTFIKNVDAESLNDGKWEIQSDWLCAVEDKLLNEFKAGNFEFFDYDAEDVEKMDEDEFCEFIKDNYFDGGVYLQIPMSKLGVFTDAEAWLSCQKDCVYTNQNGHWEEIETAQWLTLMKEAREERAEELKSNRKFIENKTEMYDWCVRVAKDNESSILKAAEYILSEHTGDNHHLVHVDFADYYEDGRLSYNLIAKHAKDDSDKNVAGECAYWLIANNVAELYS